MPMPSGKESSDIDQQDPAASAQPRGELPQRPFQGLQITATPIGNLGDLSPRAKKALEHADLIACEDTRHTGMLLSRLGITTKMVPYHDHSGDHVIRRLVAAMESGKTVTLVSDAGTPLISDPGYKLVVACRKAGIPVTSVPGPSAMLAALASSGLATDRFYFAGFLPSSSKKRRDLLVSLQPLTCTMIFYESPKRILATLADMASITPDREAVLARELTKLHESFYWGTVQGLHDQLIDTPLKGELVLMLGPMKDHDDSYDDNELAAMLQRALDDGMSRRDAVTLVTSTTGHAKKHVYGIALGLEDPRRDHDR